MNAHFVLILPSFDCSSFVRLLLGVLGLCPKTGPPPLLQTDSENKGSKTPNPTRRALLNLYRRTKLITGHTGVLSRPSQPRQLQCVGPGATRISQKYVAHANHLKSPQISRKRKCRRLYINRQSLPHHGGVELHAYRVYHPASPCASRSITTWHVPSSARVSHLMCPRVLKKHNPTQHTFGLTLPRLLCPTPYTPPHACRVVHVRAVPHPAPESAPPCASRSITAAWHVPLAHFTHPCPCIYCAPHFASPVLLS